MLEDKNQEKTSLAELGEFGLIKHLTKHFKLQHATTHKGIGDDCAVISPEGTILHGSTSPIDARRLKLRIYYTIVDEIDPNRPCAEVLGL